MIVEIGPWMAINTDIVRHVNRTGDTVQYFTDEGDYEVTYKTEKQAQYAYWNILDRSQMATVREEAPELEIVNYAFEE